MLLFKYVSPEAASKVLEAADTLSIRFGLPRTYNDPYELFLVPEAPIESEEKRAFYDYFLGKIAEAPVACFSRRPDSVVMWAHYGYDAAGICLAFDEDDFVNQLPVAWVNDIEYTDRPATLGMEHINWAYMTGKRRHTFWLLAEANRIAYFRKRIDWQYEAERRVVVLPNAVEDYNGILLGKFRPSALRYILVGPKAPPELIALCEARADQWKVPMLSLRIGTRTYTPFFTDTAGESFVWTDTDFEKASGACQNCGEPAGLMDGEICEWCDISEEARRTGPMRSMLTATLALGIDKGLPLMFAGLEARGAETATADISEAAGGETEAK